MRRQAQLRTFLHGSLVSERRRIVRFILTGCLNTAVGYALFAGLLFTGMWPQAALLVGTVLTVLFNFHTTSRWAFRQAMTANTLKRFVATYGISYGSNVLLLEGFTGIVGLAPLIAQLVCLPLVVVLTYLLMRIFVFRLPAN